MGGRQLLEDIGGITAIHEFIKASERRLVVNVLPFLQNFDDCLLHARGDLARSADEDLWTEMNPESAERYEVRGTGGDAPSHRPRTP